MSAALIELRHGARRVLIAPDVGGAIAAYFDETDKSPLHWLRPATPEALAALDLSGWRVAFNGAEPIRASTLERFARTFAACGFREQAFFPCYGLAESTLIVSGGDPDEPPVARAFRGPELVLGRVDRQNNVISSNHVP